MKSYTQFMQEQSDLLEAPTGPSSLATSQNPRARGAARGIAMRGAKAGMSNNMRTRNMVAVPTSGSVSAASGANRMTQFRAQGVNKTGGLNYQRNRLIGNPKGPGGTGNVVSMKRAGKLFGPGGRFDGKLVPDKIGKPYNPQTSTGKLRPTTRFTSGGGNRPAISQNVSGAIRTQQSQQLRTNAQNSPRFGAAFKGYQGGSRPGANRPMGGNRPGANRPTGPMK
jgi:hypothetical protein